jgi:hypothetical protein
MLEKDDGVAAAVGGSDAAESNKTATDEVSVTFTTSSPSVLLLPANVTRHLLCIKATHGDVVCEHTHPPSRRSACATTAV